MNITPEQLQSYVTELGFTCLNLPTEFIRRRLTVLWPTPNGEAEATFVFGDTTTPRHYAYRKTNNSLIEIRIV